MKPCKITEKSISATVSRSTIVGMVRVSRLEHYLTGHHTAEKLISCLDSARRHDTKHGECFSIMLENDEVS